MNFVHYPDQSVAPSIDFDRKTRITGNDNVAFLEFCIGNGFIVQFSAVATVKVTHPPNAAITNDYKMGPRHARVHH